MQSTAQVSSRTIEDSPLWVNPRMGSGAIELIKWLAILLMTIDHIDAFLLDRQVFPMFAVGRIAMPLFVMLFAYHMARPGLDARAHSRAMKRLLAFGMIAYVPYVAVNGWERVLPLNILFALFLLSCIFFLTDFAREASGIRQWLAYAAGTVIFAFGGLFVDYLWFGLAIGLAARLCFRCPTPLTALALIGALLALGLINGNQYGLLALPVFILASHKAPAIPRAPWFVYYGYYPTHLAAIWALQFVRA